MINDDRQNLEGKAGKMKDGLQNFVIMTAVKDKVLLELKPMVEDTIRLNKLAE